MSRDLVERIEKAIRLIPSTNPNYVSTVHPEYLYMHLDKDLIRKIAEIAAQIALEERG